MELDIKIIGETLTPNDASKILSAISELTDSLWKERANEEKPKIEFNFQKEKGDTPSVFRGEDSTFSRYLSSTTPEGISR